MAGAWMWGLIGTLTAGRVALGIWIAALGGSWLFGVVAVVMSLRNMPRRQVRTLRCATVACIVELMGLAMMVLFDNPGKWKAGPWLLSLLPLALAMAAVIVASARGDVIETAEASG